MYSDRITTAHNPLKGWSRRRDYTQQKAMI
jgi:hypothetical protein